MSSNLLWKYARGLERVSGEVRGLRLRPDWAKSDFRPLQLHGENRIGYAQVLLSLENLLVNHPKDAHLLFTYAYLLWFDGRRDEAQAILEGLAPNFAEPKLIEPFLEALPSTPVI